MEQRRAACSGSNIAMTLGAMGSDACAARPASAIIPRPAACTSFGPNGIYSNGLIRTAMS
jgi:hypothetical protein